MLTRAVTAAALLCLLGGVWGCSDIGETETTGTTAAKAIKADSSRDAYAAAREAIEEDAPDALLVSVGTSGVALADVPSSWVFMFYSPGDRHLRRVAVEHGTAQPPEDLGESQVEFDVAAAVDFDSINVAAAEAVESARAFGERSGEVPENVMVGGSFLNSPEAEDIGFVPGSWSVTFVRGTSNEGMVGFWVDMNTGEVTATPDE